MSDIIRLLPDSVANQIAAGEVVQRPASVVKELIDNSIDAGADEIILNIKEAGKLLISVQDNGIGMSPADARMCWERHATSKISRAEDLFRLQTMGFRGEALASIAAVAQVEMKSRRAEEELGTQIVIEGGEILKQDMTACATGTQIVVKNLFYNIPARRNFLKSNPVETRHIINEFIRGALAHPEISFRMISNGTELFSLEASDLKGRIIQVFDEKKEADLLELAEETSMMKVYGFAGVPAAARKTRDEQFFFVNRRFIKDAYLNHAVMSCYEQLISKEQFPFYVIHLEINPAEIDVNIHPTKTEVKFIDEKSIYSILKSILKKALGAYHHVPLYDGSAIESFIPQNRHADEAVGLPRQPELRVNRGFNPFAAEQSTYKRDKTYGWEKLFEVVQKEESQPLLPEQKGRSNIFSLQQDPLEDISMNQMMQLQQQYILCQHKDGLLLIDQQAAHERILFERYLRAVEQNPISSQQKLFPKVVKLGKKDFETALELLPEMKAMGLDVAEFGTENLIVHGMPADVQDMDEQLLIETLLADCRQETGKQREWQKEQMAQSLARQAGMKRGTSLQADEMRLLLEQLFNCDYPALTHGGKKTYVIIGREELLNMFA